MAKDVIAVLPELFFASHGECLRHYWGAHPFRATEIPAGRVPVDGLAAGKTAIIRARRGERRLTII
jgi:hypothetical protein